MCVCMFSHFSHVWLFAASWTVAHQAPLSIGFSRQEYWSGLPRPPPRDLPDPGIEPTSLASPALQVDLLPLSHREALWCHVIFKKSESCGITDSWTFCIEHTNLSFLASDFCISFQIREIFSSQFGWHIRVRRCLRVIFFLKKWASSKIVELIHLLQESKFEEQGQLRLEVCMQISYYLSMPRMQCPVLQSCIIKMFGTKVPDLTL